MDQSLGMYLFQGFAFLILLNIIGRLISIFIKTMGFKLFKPYIEASYKAGFMEADFTTRLYYANYNYLPSTAWMRKALVEAPPKTIVDIQKMDSVEDQING